MFDSHKIDDYFDGEKPLDVGYQTQKPQESGFYRFAKLGFPSVAAPLLGLMIVMPNIKIWWTNFWSWQSSTASMRRRRRMVNFTTC